MGLASKLHSSYFGNLGESYAKKLLQSKGYRILETKFRSKFGEIDLVTLKDNTIIFIEVKTRWSNKFGKPEESVTKSKIKKLKRTAEYYSLTNPNLPRKLLIQVVAIEIEDNYVAKYRIITVD